MGSVIFYLGGGEMGNGARGGAQIPSLSSNGAIKRILSINKGGSLIFFKKKQNVLFKISYSRVVITFCFTCYSTFHWQNTHEIWLRLGSNSTTLLVQHCFLPRPLCSWLPRLTLTMCGTSNVAQLDPSVRQ